MEIYDVVCPFQSQAEELGIDKGSLANMSKVELAMRSDDPALLTAWQKKKVGKSGRVGVMSGMVSLVILWLLIHIT